MKTHTKPIVNIPEILPENCSHHWRSIHLVDGKFEYDCCLCGSGVEEIGGEWVVKNGG